MDPADVDKTSFVKRKRKFRFKVLPFGLTNAGATYQRVMNGAMADHNFTICVKYLNDMILLIFNGSVPCGQIGVKIG